MEEIIFNYITYLLKHNIFLQTSCAPEASPSFVKMWPECRWSDNAVTKHGEPPQQFCMIYPSESQGLPLNGFFPRETFTCFASQQGQGFLPLPPQFKESAWSPLKKKKATAIELLALTKISVPGRLIPMEPRGVEGHFLPCCPGDYNPVSYCTRSEHSHNDFKNI